MAKPAQQLLGIDQYGDMHHLKTSYPRKELMQRLGKTTCSKIYVDDSNGNSRHTGYLVGRLWVDIYKVTPWKG